jgi:undecaprenyl-diphosphatase
MDWLQVVVLAVIQGVTEILPISSSGHLLLPSILLGWPDQGLAFDVAMHMGTLAAVIIYFRKDLWAMIQSWCGSVFKQQHDQHSRLAWQIALATIPAAIVGVLADDYIEENFRHIGVVTTTTFVYAILLAFADRTGHHRTGIFSMTWRMALIIGCAQALALIPGTSRSGVTMTAALLLGMTRESSARFSFLMSVPIIAAAGSLKMLDLIQHPPAEGWTIVFVGMFIAAITAYLCIAGFLRFIASIGMMPFVIYRLLLGCVLIGVMFVAA